MELEINKNENDKENKLFEIEYNKRAQLYNQDFEKEKDEHMLNIMMQQMMMAKIMQNNMKQENS